MKKEIRDKRINLLHESKALQERLFEVEADKVNEVKKKQDEAYKKWKFYDNIIKASDKIK